MNYKRKVLQRIFAQGGSMTDRELLQMALDALEDMFDDLGPMQHKTIEALRAALAQSEQASYPENFIDALRFDTAIRESQPEQEPIKHWSDCAVHNAPAYPSGKCDCGGVSKEQEPTAYLCENAVGHKYFRWKKPSSEYKPIALYTAHASPQRIWQGLTDDEQMQVAWSCGAMSADWLDFARAIEAKLKEKNE